MVQASHFHEQTAVSAPGLFGRLFGKKDKESDQDATPELASINPAVLAARKRYEAGLISQRKPAILKFSRHAIPVEKIELILKNVLHTCEVKVDAEDWKTTQLTQRDVKLRVISAAVKRLKRPIHNRALNNISTVAELLDEFVQKPVQRDAGHPVALFYKENADELPANMKFESFGKNKRKLHVDQ
ncbi:hypothetical protein LPJ59_005136 [Coemansia sp. RSA 2399]|nr:hypothetical protein LPJ59_005136 [Coemansia sp. RSA 2399]KAJ1895442.1 hypothetical protein LPJ81_004956 [Coemansia sp. IMI 209127]